MEEKKFTIEEIKKYLMSVRGLESAIENLTAENIMKINEGEEDDFDECDASIFDLY